MFEWLVLGKESPDAKNDATPDDNASKGKHEIVFQTDKITENKGLRILHFNDVYNIEEKESEPVSGTSRFYTAMRHFDNGIHWVYGIYRPCMVISYSFIAALLLNLEFLDCLWSGENM